MPELKQGDVVAERYQIERLLGVGGMGSVYAAFDRMSGQRRAIKVLHEALLQHPVIPQRFMREAQAARALATPHAVKVEATGTLHDQAPFIVMEFLDGQDLAFALSRARGRFAVERALSLIDQVAAALEEAHQRGIIHRDLKPENIFVIPTAGGELVKVVDFGISKIVTREEGAKLTRTGTTLGTPHYMPIEQLRGAKDLDGRVDVYAIGVILYQVLAGVRPFNGATYEEVILKVATTRPPSLTSLRSDVPPGLIGVVERAMAHDRQARFASMTELRRAIAPFWSGRCPVCTPSVRPSSPSPLSPSSANPPMVRGATMRMEPSAAAPQPVAARAPGGAKSKPQRAAVVAVVVVIVVTLATLLIIAAGGAGAWWYWSS